VDAQIDVFQRYPGHPLHPGRGEVEDRLDASGDQRLVVLLGGVRRYGQNTDLGPRLGDHPGQLIDVADGEAADLAARQVIADVEAAAGPGDLASATGEAAL